MKNRKRIALLLTIAAALSMGASTCQDKPPLGDTLVFHKVVLDESGKLLPWTSYGRVVDLAWNAFKNVKVLGSTGLPTYYTHSMFDGGTDSLWNPGGWAHNPAGLAAMLADSAVQHYGYSGDAEAVAKVRAYVDYFLENGLTPLDWEWSGVPFTASHPGDKQYRGGDDRVFCWEGKPCGRGDGIGFLETDKTGELGWALVRLHEQSGERKYLEHAIRFADNLVKHYRTGNELKSPWPFRVDGKTGKIIREEYTANVIFAIMLFEELARLGEGQTAEYTRVRNLTWNWMMKYPVKNMYWQGYFEDIPIFEKPWQNPNQYSAIETARYLLQNAHKNPEYRRHAKRIIDWTKKTFAGDVDSGQWGFEPGIQWGAEAISEQGDDMAKMGSHTARFASVLAMYSVQTGDASAKERAFRSFNWATYPCDHRGIVKVGPNDREGFWFSDGYGDYMRHYLHGFAAMPEWAPQGENHLLSTTSVIRNVEYKDEAITYQAFDGNGVETFRLKARPVAVSSGSVQSANRVQSKVEEITGTNGVEGFLLTVKRDGVSSITVRMQ